jgi:rubrerythrin
MTNTNTIDSLVRQFEELKAMEDASAQLYMTILPDVTDAADKEVVQRIIVDEQKHSKMAQNIIDIIKS